MNELILLLLWLNNKPTNLNCEYLYYSNHGTEIENIVCSEEYIDIEREAKKIKYNLINY